MQDLANEILIMNRGIVCDNITHLNEIYEDDNCIYLIMDYCEGGNLFDKLGQVTFFSHKECRVILR